ncbi:MAG: DUF4325 domain-containing protein [Planctomycetota bacterium]
MNTIRISEDALRSAANGSALAEQILRLLDAGDHVEVDMASVEAMTPSYANALVMTLLDRVPLEQLKVSCQFTNRNAHVVNAMNTAANRYLSGIRLSSQMVTA